MEIEEIKNKLNSWDDNLTKQQKRSIHYSSMRNFAYHFDKLPNEDLKVEVKSLLSDYLEDVENNGCNYRGEESFGLMRTYVHKLSPIYSKYLEFRTFMKLKFVVILSILGDGFLYLLLRSEIKYYFPIVFISLLTYYLYIRFKFVPQKKAFGFFY
jgi:hypothetical protein